MIILSKNNLSIFDSNAYFCLCAYPDTFQVIVLDFVFIAFNNIKDTLLSISRWYTIVKTLEQRFRVRVQYYKIGPSGVRALPLGIAAERSVHYIWYYFVFFFSATYFSPGRGCPRVMKFCPEF